jgi:hypothetical protein
VYLFPVEVSFICNVIVDEIEPKAPIGVVKLSPPEHGQPAEVSVLSEPKEEPKEAPPVTSAPTKKRFGTVISSLSDDTARTNLESSTIVSASQLQLGASTAAMCNTFAESVKEFYSNLISETQTRVDPGAVTLQNALDSLCAETANECEKLQKDLGSQAQEQLKNVRAALNSQELSSSKDLEEILQQSITETHDLAASVLQKTREQSLSFLEDMNELHNETVSSVLREAGADESF